MWELTRWGHDSSLSAVTHVIGYRVGATFIVLQTPTKRHLVLLFLLQQNKQQGAWKEGEGSVTIRPPKASRAVRCQGWTRVRPASSLLAAQAGLRWPSRCCPDWLLDCIPLTQGCAQLFSWPLPKHLSERAGMRMLHSKATTALKSSSLCQKQGCYMWEVSCRKKSSSFISM